MDRETSVIKENPRAILKAVLRIGTSTSVTAGLILVTETEAAPDDQIGLQGFLILKGSNPRISDWSIAATSFSIFPSLPERI